MIVHLVNSQVFVLVGESLVDILQDGQESHAGRAPGSKELYQDLVVVTEDPGELLEGVNGGDGGSLVPLTVVLVLSPPALHHLVTPGSEGQQSSIVTLGVTSPSHLPCTQPSIITRRCSVSPCQAGDLASDTDTAGETAEETGEDEEEKEVTEEEGEEDEKVETEEDGEEAEDAA